MNLKLTTCIGLAVLLAGCGGSDESLEAEPEVSKAIKSAPDTVESGQRFLVTVDSELTDLTFSVEPEIYYTQVDESRWELVAPGGEQYVQSMEITVEGSDGVNESLAVTVSEPSPSSLVDLPRPYPFVTSWLPSYENGPFDELGVPMFTYNGETDYFPIQISKIGQALYNLIYQGTATTEQEQLFITVADWLRDNCEYNDWGFCSWQTQIDVPSYQLPESWTSAMAQGQAISALVGAYGYTGDASYLQVVYDALPAFNYPIKEKGVRADYDGVPWYEEYGSEIEPAHVLNGFLFGLAGVYDAYEILDSQTAKQVYGTGIESLVARIDRFDLGFTSWYDDSSLKQVSSMKGPVGDGYHELHIFQLLWTYEHSQEPKILEYADKFLQYDTRAVDSFGRFKEITRKITSVEASATYSERFPAELLVDSNWTYRRYWVSDVNPTTLILGLNEASVSGEITLNGIRLTGVHMTDLPDTIALYSCKDAPVLIDGPFKTSERIGEPFEVLLEDYYRGNTVVVDTQELELPCGDLMMEMTSNTESGLVRFRELNLHYSQTEALKEIREFYQTQFSVE